jgi:transcriptional regulator with XRE-family HTH domain
VIDFLKKITNVNTLKERLTYARELRGLTQGELAAKAKCAQSAIGNAESGERKTLRNLVLVARVLKVSADWLFDGNGPKPTQDPTELLGYSTRQVVPLIASDVARNTEMQAIDPYTRAALELMQKLRPDQREGALAALKTHCSYLGPPRIGQAL